MDPHRFKNMFSCFYPLNLKFHIHLYIAKDQSRQVIQSWMHVIDLILKYACPHGMFPAYCTFDDTYAKEMNIRSTREHIYIRPIMLFEGRWICWVHTCSHQHWFWRSSVNCSQEFVLLIHIIHRLCNSIAGCPWLVSEMDIQSKVNQFMNQLNIL